MRRTGWWSSLSPSACHQNDPIRATNQPVEVSEVTFGEPELADTDFDVVFVQQSHHTGLAMVGGDNANSQIELFVANGDLDSPIGGASFLGYVDLGEDLDACDDGREHSAWGVFSLHTNAINPVADSNTVLERFDMDVAGPELDRFLDHQIDQPDDRVLLSPTSSSAAMPSASVSVKSIAVSVNPATSSQPIHLRPGRNTC